VSRTLRVIIHALQGIAQGCRDRISKGFSFLCPALCCTVLRSRWCQSGVNQRQESRRRVCGVRSQGTHFRPLWRCVQLRLGKRFVTYCSPMPVERGVPGKTGEPEPNQRAEKRWTPPRSRYRRECLRSPNRPHVSYRGSPTNSESYLSSISATVVLRSAPTSCSVRNWTNSSKGRSKPPGMYAASTLPGSVPTTLAE
jgi:hypothetical protein